MESPAFKEFLKQYWNFRTHDEKIQYNPIDVKSLVEKQSYKYNTHWTDQNQHVKIHMGFFFKKSFDRHKETFAGRHKSLSTTWKIHL